MLEEEFDFALDSEEDALELTLDEDSSELLEKALDDKLLLTDDDALDSREEDADELDRSLDELERPEDDELS